MLMRWGWIVLCLGMCLRGETTFDQAAAFYDGGDYAKALEIYQSIPGLSASLDYNRANSLVRLNRKTEALAYFRRAQWLQPGDADISANLTLLAKELSVTPPPLPVHRRLTALLGPAGWQRSWLVGCWVLAGWGLLCMWEPRLRSASLWVVPLMILFWGTAGYGVWASHPSHFMSEAVVETETLARFAPLPDATEHFELDPGSLIRIQDTRRNWLKISHADKEGWILKQNVLRLGEL